jgi:GT2 family glycosyltransferase
MEEGRRGCDHGRRGPTRYAGRVVAARCTAIVPAYLAEATLERTLRSLLVDNAADVDRVVVVASPGDASASVARAFSAVEVVESPRRLSAGRARNLGRASARDAELLLFVDADCRVGVGTVALMIDVLLSERRCAVAASVISRGPRFQSWLRHVFEFKDAGPGVVAPCPWLLPSTTLLCRADAFDDAGGFEDMWPGEDWVLSERLREASCSVRRVDEAHTYHLHPSGWGRLLAHQYRLGTTSARARALTGMDGVAFVRHPSLAPLLLVGRFVRGLLWFCRYRPRELPLFVIALPLYVAGLAVWTLGFTAGALARR